ncbi:MAG TPA: glycosyltransferase, partial [bacterium]|nr:glycosyltransferase [bacterium]
YAILYSGHPAKGLEAAVEVLRLLRVDEPRFSLQVYGGRRLWGESEGDILKEPGVHDHGLTGQRRLARRMQACGFSFNLQTIQESFGMAVIEAMRAGCIVLASPVGAYPETVRHGDNGFLLPGDPAEAATQAQAARLMADLVKRPEYCEALRRSAEASPLDWKTIAAAWAGHWDWALGNTPGKAEPASSGSCPDCSADLLPLADGVHCTGCGRYTQVQPG